MELPAMVARDLTGRRLRLPAEMEGRLNVLLLFHTREGEEAARVWVLYVKQMEQAHGALWYYLAPTPAPMAALGRLATRLRLRRRIRDAGVRRRYLLLGISRAALWRALEPAEGEEVEAYLIDRSGHIFWRAAGRVTPEKVRSLAEALEAARTQATP